MKYHILVLSAFLSLSVFSQINQQIEDTKHEQIILIDEINKEGLLMEEYQEWFTKEYDAYQMDSLVLDSLSTVIGELQEFNIIVFMSTWCHDSREQVPRFYKILETINSEVNMKIYGLDEFKSCTSMDVPSYNIELVPTFIFYLKDEEIGRIIETPETKLETDFLKIIRTGSK